MDYDFHFRAMLPRVLKAHWPKRMPFSGEEPGFGPRLSDSRAHTLKTPFVRTPRRGRSCSDFMELRCRLGEAQP